MTTKVGQLSSRATSRATTAPGSTRRDRYSGPSVCQLSERQPVSASCLNTKQPASMRRNSAGAMNLGLTGMDVYRALTADLDNNISREDTDRTENGTQIDATTPTFRSAPKGSVRAQSSPSTFRTMQSTQRRPHTRPSSRPEKPKRKPWDPLPATPKVLMGAAALQTSDIPLDMNLQLVFQPRTWKPTTMAHYSKAAQISGPLFEACTAKAGPSVGLRPQYAPKYTPREARARVAERARRMKGSPLMRPKSSTALQTPLTPIGPPGRCPDFKMTGTLHNGKIYAAKPRDEYPQDSDCGHFLSCDNHKTVCFSTGL